MSLLGARHPVIHVLPSSETVAGCSLGFLKLHTMARLAGWLAGWAAIGKGRLIFKRKEILTNYCKHTVLN